MADRRIIVTQCRIVTSGTGKNQRPYTIYEIEATREDRTPLPADMKLRSFEDLPLNEVLDVTVEVYRSDKYGDSYTIKRKGQGGGDGLGKEMKALRERMASAEQKIEQLAARVFGGGNSGATPTDLPTDLPTTAPTSAGSPAGSVPTDDDIPF